MSQDIDQLWWVTSPNTDAKREGKDPQKAAMGFLYSQEPYPEEELKKRTENHPCNKEFTTPRHTGHPFHGKGVAKFRCNKCGGIYKRDLGWKAWTPSYCGKTDQPARLYRISSPNAQGLPPADETPNTVGS